jgi:hypothetical protein
MIAERGKHLYDEYRSKRERRVESGPDDHRYVSVNTDKRASKFPPTERDQRHVDRYWNKSHVEEGSKDDSVHWIFEKMLCRNPNNRFLGFERIIHLFARVDDDGNIQEVSLIVASRVLQLTLHTRESLSRSKAKRIWRG